MADVTRREIIGKLAATAGVGALLTAATAEASEDAKPESTHSESRGSDLHIEYGMIRKPNGGEYTVKFKREFSGPPTVLLTPYWHDQGSQVSYIETLVHVSHREFRGVSDNAAENYYVSWVAIGRKRD